MARMCGTVVLATALLVVAGAATAQTYQTLAHFSGEEGEPSAGLIRGSDGSYYGTTRSGGKYGVGSVYRLTLHGSVRGFETIHAFRDIEGATLSGELVEARDGYFYGTAATGGPTGSGTIFQMSPNGRVRVLYAFDRDTTGELPTAGLIQASDGYLYGTTMRGVAGGVGTVFRIDTQGAITVLHTFDYLTGASSVAQLVEGRDGRLYGTTMGGGTFLQGVLFSIDTSGSLTVLHSFEDHSTGSLPEHGVTFGRDGNLYGTTFNGGAFGLGTMFRYATLGRERKILIDYLRNNRTNTSISAYSLCVLTTGGSRNPACVSRHRCATGESINRSRAPRPESPRLRASSAAGSRIFCHALEHSARFLKIGKADASAAAPHCRSWMACLLLSRGTWRLWQKIGDPVKLAQAC